METLETAIATAEDAQAKAENELIEYAIEQKKREEVQLQLAINVQHVVRTHLRSDRQRASLVTHTLALALAHARRFSSCCASWRPCRRSW
jgi:hypothetical protein